MQAICVYIDTTNMSIRDNVSPVGSGECGTQSIFGVLVPQQDQDIRKDVSKKKQVETKYVGQVILTPFYPDPLPIAGSNNQTNLNQFKYEAGGYWDLEKQLNITIAIIPWFGPCLNQNDWTLESEQHKPQSRGLNRTKGGHLLTQGGVQPRVKVNHVDVMREPLLSQWVESSSSQ